MFAGARNLLIDHILKDDFVSRLTPGKEGKSSQDIKQEGGRRKQKGGDSNKLAIEAIQHIYSDPSLLIAK